jgi:uncharacterized protein (DUF697 family)
MGLGIFPSKLFNVLSVSANNLNLTRKLCRLYGVEFSEEAAKNILAAVLGGIPGALAVPYVESIVGLIPFVGASLFYATAPLLGGLETYALGRMLVAHFERGGSLADINDPVMPHEFS